MGIGLMGCGGWLRGRRGFLLVLALFAAVDGAAGDGEAGDGEADRLMVASGFEQEDVRPYGMFREDPEGVLSWKDLVHGGAEEFRPLDRGDLGTTASVYWLRFPVVNRDWENRQFILSAGQAVEWMRVYVVPSKAAARTAEVSVESAVAGYHLPGRERPVRAQNTAVSLRLEPGTEYTVVMRLESRTSLSLDPVLWRAEDFYEARLVSHYFYGILLGVLLGLFLYNAALGLFLRDRAYGFYLLFLGSFTGYLLAISGFGSLYVWAGYAGFSLAVIYVFLNLMLAGLLLFAYEILGVRRVMPRLRAAFLGGAGFFLLYAPLSLGLPVRLNNTLPVYLGLPAAVLVIGAGIVSYRRAHKASRFFLAAEGAFILGLVVYGLKLLGLVPSNPVTGHAFQIFAVAGCLGFSFSVSDRFNLFRRQREEAQARSVRTLEMMNAQKDDFVRKSSRFVPREFLASIGKPDITRVQLGECSAEDMIILFADLFRFTDLSENLPPRRLFDLINSHLAEMGPCIRRNGGFVDKYIGDGIMALFPGDGVQGIRAAVEMQRILERRGPLEGAALRMGVGLHAGSLILGTIGESERMETTVLSDHVNLASRVEHLTRYYNTRVLVTRGALDRAGGSGNSGFSLRRLDVVRVKGRREPVEVWEILDAFGGEDLRLREASKGAFAQARTALLEGRPGPALEGFSAVLEENPGDGAARAYAERCRLLLERGGPEEGWDAVLDFNEEGWGWKG